MGYDWLPEFQNTFMHSITVKYTKAMVKLRKIINDLNPEDSSLCHKCDKIMLTIKKTRAITEYD